MSISDIRSKRRERELENEEENEIDCSKRQRERVVCVVIALCSSIVLRGERVPALDLPRASFGQ